MGWNVKWMGLRTGCAPDANFQGKSAAPATTHSHPQAMAILRNQALLPPGDLLLRARASEVFNGLLLAIGIAGAAGSRVCPEQIKMNPYDIRPLFPCLLQFRNGPSQISLSSQRLSINHVGRGFIGSELDRLFG